MSDLDSESEDAADRRVFVLPPDEFDAFVALLDASPGLDATPRLAALFADREPLAKDFLP